MKITHIDENRILIVSEDAIITTTEDEFDSAMKNAAIEWYERSSKWEKLKESQRHKKK